MSASGGDPAQRLVTQQNWEDLALAPETLGQVRDIHKELAAADDPGTYRVVFSGPAGTGKTLTATLLGQQFGRDVYRIDLSQVVSKFIGETEKNLEHLLARAEQED